MADTTVHARLDDDSQLALRLMVRMGMTESEAVRTALVEAAEARRHPSRAVRPGIRAVPGGGATGAGAALTSTHRGARPCGTDDTPERRTAMFTSG